MRPKTKPSAEIILLPKQLRMDWMDVLSTDPELPPASHKVAGAIGTHFGNKSGLTYVSQKTLATVTGLSIATVTRAVLDLEARGYIQIERREIGLRADGKKVYGGKGVANVYLPAIDSIQISATDRGQRLVARVNESWNAKHITGDVLSASKHLTGDVLCDGHSTSNTSAKHITGDVPTLSSPSEKNSSRARRPSCPNGLGLAGESIQSEIGSSKFRSWFAQVEIVSSCDGVVTLSAPTKFIRDTISQQFDDVLVRAWRSSDRSVKRVVVVTAASRKETA